MNINQLIDSNLMQSVNNKRDKLIISALCIWSFVHTYLIIRSSQFDYIESRGLRFLDLKIFSPTSMFYPFTKNGWFNGRYYDFSEYFVYVGGAWLMYLLYRLFRKYECPVP